MTTQDITTLDYQELLELRARVDARIEEVRKTHAADLLTRFDHEAQRLGLSAAELVNGRRKRRSRKDAQPDEEPAA